MSWPGSSQGPVLWEHLGRSIAHLWLPGDLDWLTPCGRAKMRFSYSRTLGAKNTRPRNAGKFRRSRNRSRQGMNSTVTSRGRPQRTVWAMPDGNISPSIGGATLLLPASPVQSRSIAWEGPNRRWPMVVFPCRAPICSVRSCPSALGRALHRGIWCRGWCPSHRSGPCR